MRAVVTCAALLCAMPASAGVKESFKLRTEKDEFEGKTRVRLSLADIDGRFQLSLNWQYLKCHPLVFLIDGRRLRVESDDDGTIGDGYVFEQVTFSDRREADDGLSRKELIAWSKAKNIKGKICNDTFEFPPELIELIGDFVRAMKWPGAPPAPKHVEPPPDTAPLSDAARVVDMAKERGAKVPPPPETKPEIKEEPKRLPKPIVSDSVDDSFDEDDDGE